MIHIQAQLTRRSGASIENPLYQFFRNSKTWDLSSSVVGRGHAEMTVGRRDGGPTTKGDCAKLETSFRRMCARHGMNIHSLDARLINPEPEVPAEELGRHAYLPHGNRFGREGLSD